MRRFGFAYLTVMYSALTLSAMSCAGSIPQQPSVSAMFPHEGALVTAQIQSNELVVKNNGENEVIHVIFPSEILPLIEWAPCWEPDRCDETQRIIPGGTKSYPLDALVEKDTEGLSLFWWELVLDETNAEYLWPEVKEIHIPLK